MWSVDLITFFESKTFHFATDLFINESVHHLQMLVQVAFESAGEWTEVTFKWFVSHVLKYVTLELS